MCVFTIYISNFIEHGFISEDEGGAASNDAETATSGGDSLASTSATELVRKFQQWNKNVLIPAITVTKLNQNNALMKSDKETNESTSSFEQNIVVGGGGGHTPPERRQTVGISHPPLKRTSISAPDTSSSSDGVSSSSEINISIQGSEETAPPVNKEDEL